MTKDQLMDVQLMGISSRKMGRCLSGIMMLSSLGNVKVVLNLFFTLDSLEYKFIAPSLKSHNIE